MQILSLIYNMDSSQSPLDDPSPDTSPHVPATPPPFFAHQAGDYEQSTGFYSAGPPAFLVHDHDEDEDEDTSGENVGFASLENRRLLGQLTLGRGAAGGGGKGVGSRVGAVPVGALVRHGPRWETE